MKSFGARHGRFSEWRSGMESVFLPATSRYVSCSFKTLLVDVASQPKPRFEERRRNNVVAPILGGLEEHNIGAGSSSTAVRPQRWQMRTPGRSLVRRELLSCGERRT